MHRQPDTSSNALELAEIRKALTGLEEDVAVLRAEEIRPQPPPA